MSAKNSKANANSKPVESTNVSDFSIVLECLLWNFIFFPENHKSTNKCTCCIDIDYIKGAEYNSKISSNRK